MSGIIQFRKAKMLGTIRTNFGVENTRLIQYQMSNGERGEEQHTDTSLAQTIKKWEFNGVKVIEI